MAAVAQAGSAGGARPRTGLLRRREPMELLIAVQLVLIAAGGIGVALGLPLWGISDENAHASFVAAVGAGHFPLLGHFQIQPDVANLVPNAASFFNQSYEVFEPPLYYIVMAIPWDLAKAAGGALTAVHVVRLLDVGLLGIDVWLLWALARRVAPSRQAALVAYAFALTFVLWPGIVFRSVTISNATLEMPLTTAALLALWIAFDEGSSRALVAAGALCGVGWLCRLPFPVVALLPVVAWRFRRSAPRTAVLALVLPVLLISPWLIENLVRYHALSAEAIYHRMQVGLFNPGDRPYGLHRLLDTSQNLLAGILPDEWSSAATVLGGYSFSVGLLHIARAALVAWLLLPFGLWLWRGPRRVWPLVVPLLLGVVLMWVETAAERMLLISPRYVYPQVPAFGLACGLALAGLRGRGDPELRSDRRPTRALALVATLTVALTGLWLYGVFAVTPFVNSGHHHVL